MHDDGEPHHADEGVKISPPLLKNGGSYAAGSTSRYPAPGSVRM